MVAVLVPMGMEMGQVRQTGVPGGIRQKQGGFPGKWVCSDCMWSVRLSIILALLVILVMKV